ncbi:MAG: redox-sensing transcriptional repressor Rex [Bacteroidales bacterium]|nr:MAG: redox-sensing transcriptional repressor Rex [Bacteroidales bacterium]
MRLPATTIARLSKYRRMLGSFNYESTHIFSHNLAKLLNLTPEQVRRDLMLIGLTGNHRKGYNIKELIDLVSKTIDSEKGHNVAIVGMGNLGMAVTAFIRRAKTRLNIVAAFDIDSGKIGKKVADVTCYHVDDISDIVRDLSISIAVLTVPPGEAIDVATLLIKSGIKGILNFTSVHIDVPPHVYLKETNIITSLEEIGFFIKEGSSK